MRDVRSLDVIKRLVSLLLLLHCMMPHAIKVYPRLAVHPRIILVVACQTYSFATHKKKTERVTGCVEKTNKNRI